MDDFNDRAEQMRRRLSGIGSGKIVPPARKQGLCHRCGGTLEVVDTNDGVTLRCKNSACPTRREGIRTRFDHLLEGDNS